ncbi:MAG TPA: ankyrin repeat domain-containing protein [Thermoanaerobaculia bacterium]|nr:ankyrin repeat domain-containing protein [Thermoanaerobaculia bacterium]
MPDRGPALDKELVREFVVAAHANLARTKEMLAAQPALVNATWDWGGGDWETGLGGASHMGSREIAEHLLASGARMDVFCAAMLGRIEIVKAFLAADPGVVHLRGPHGIPLVRHAAAGKQQAVVDLLVAAGAQA